MAASGLDAFGVNMLEKVKKSKVLVVGAGGIGCELLKNIVLTGFTNIEIIDLDTIDVSNLNRQFLFQKQHVGKSKAKVARDGVLKLNPSATITAHHDSILNSEFGPDYFKQFDVVLNALDNRNARSHVNRMCLAADIPLVESGTAGYLGQVTLIKKGSTECYECEPKPPQKTYPGCTIRNTPSEPIHCIVWAKHLFNQLFGEADPDEDVSPDTADPEAVGDAGNNALENKANDAGNVERVSTRAWALSSGYNAEKLINKLFHDDIKYLLSMAGLWQKRRPPTPLNIKNLPDAVAGPSREDVTTVGIRDQRIWSIRECADVLGRSVATLKKRLDAAVDGEFLVWDKDDNACMDFVTACANIRSHVFGIQQKSRFDVKSMAGNIIPAIATTNAIIAGLIVMEALKVLQGKFDDCRTVYLNKRPNPKGMLLVPSPLFKPNPKCYVCSPKPQVLVKLNTETFTVGNLESKILKSYLHMVAPDVVIDDGKGTILISSEEGETEINNSRFLSDFGIRSGARLKCDDFLQNYELVITIANCTGESLPDGQDFEVIANMDQLSASRSDAPNGQCTNHKDKQAEETSVDDDDDLLVVENEQDGDVQREKPACILSPVRKRNISDDSRDFHVLAKKNRIDSDSDDAIIIL